MTEARVELTEEAKEDLRDLDGSTRVQVVKGLRKLQEDPQQRGQPLGNRLGLNLTGYRRLVIGDRAIRVVYRVSRLGDVCVVIVIAERSDERVYELAKARLSCITDRATAQDLSSILEQVNKL